MLFLVTSGKRIKSFFPVLQVIVHLEVHVVRVLDRFELLEIRHVLFRVFLSLRSNQSHQVEIKGGQRNIKKLVRVDKP